MTQEDEQRLAMLKAKLSARTGKPGFEANIVDLQKEIDRIEKANA